MGLIIPEDINLINVQLIDKYGITLDGKPKFRIVWSENELEHRKTSYRNGIVLIHPEIVELKKYNYLKDRWILERWVAHSSTAELVTTEGGSYEAVWAFQGPNHEYIRPVWRAVEILVAAAEGNLDYEKLTPKDFELMESQAFDKEVEEFEDQLAENAPNFGNQTDAFVSPVFYDSTKVFKGN